MKKPLSLFYDLPTPKIFNESKKRAERIMKFNQQTKIEYFRFDKNDSTNSFIEDLEIALKPFGITVYIDPSSALTESPELILSDNPRLTVGECKELVINDCGGDPDAINAWLKPFKMSSDDLLEKLIKKVLTEQK